MMDSTINGNGIKKDTATLKNDAAAFVKDAQDLFREATIATGEKANDLRNKGMALLDVALTRGREAQTSAIKTTREMAKSADNMVHESPWKAVAISAGVGLLVGLIVGRK